MTRVLFLLLVATLWPPTLAHAGPLAGAQSPDINLVRIALSFLLCAIVAVGAILFIRKRSNTLSVGLNKAGRRIDVKEARRIGVSADVCRFECDGREFLVVVTPQSALLLRERDINEPRSS